MFWLKKTVSFWLMPLPLALGLLAAALVLLALGRRTRLARGLGLAALLVLFLASNRFASNRIMAPLEVGFAPVPELTSGAPASLADCRFVAVLGGGNSAMPGVAATSQLSTSALARLVEAVRVLRALPDARLIVSGPGDPGEPTHASILRAAAVSLGVDPGRISEVDTALDTADEARIITRMAGGSRIALVTSAWHMRRAARLFGAAGARFTPCPADYASRRSGRPGVSDLGLDSESLARSTLAAHEWLGLLWMRLRGT